MTDIELFRMIAPEFSATLDSDVTNWVSLAAGMIDEAFFGTQYQLALIYLTAHYLKVSKLESGGAISSVKTGDIAVSYGTSSTAGAFGETSFGRMYQDILLQRPGASPMLINI